jgi:hypothetical protein
MNIGFLSEDTVSKNYIKEFSGFNLIEIPFLIEQKNYSTIPFYFNSKTIDYIFIYSHLFVNQRQTHVGINWIRNFRLCGYNTPIILFVWNACKDIRIKFIQRNPFITSFCEESCKLIRLPSTREKILDTVKNMNPLNQKKWEESCRFTLYGEIKHRLENIVVFKDIDKIKDELLLLIKEVPSNVKDELQKLSSVQDIDKLKSEIFSLIKNFLLIS